MSELIVKHNQDGIELIGHNSQFNFNQTVSEISKFIVINLYKMGDMGPEAILSEFIPDSNLDTNYIMKMGVFYMTALGQGHNCHTGLYGPLPVPEHPSYFSLVYSFTVPDCTNKDERNKGKSFCVLSLSFPKNLEDSFLTRKEIESNVHQYMQTFEELPDIKMKDLKKLKSFLIQ